MHDIRLINLMVALVLAVGGPVVCAAGDEDTWAAVQEQLEKRRAEPPAAEPSKAPQSPQEMQKQMEAVSPMFGMMMGQMIKSMAKTLADPAVAQDYATFARNYYQALVEKGFSKEEALSIVRATGLPSVGQKN